MQPKRSSVPATRRVAAAFALVALAAPAPLAHSQGGGNPNPAPTTPAGGLEAVTVDGFRAFIELMEEFARSRLDQLPSAEQSPRENAYGQLAAIQLAGATGALALPAVGLALGSGVGLCVDAGTAGGTVGTGTLAGGAIGLGGGIYAGFGVFVASLVATVPMVDAIESRFPAPTTAGPAALGGRGPRANFMVGPGSTSAPPVSAVSGPFESYYVNVVSALPDAAITLFEQWDRTPGLAERERAWLRSVEFARPYLARLAWIKRNQRVAPGAARATDMFLDVGRVLSGDQAAMERAWLGALQLGSTSLELKNERLSLGIPPPLRRLGLPQRLSANVPALRVRAGGNGGALDPFLRFQLVPGPFDLTWGAVEVVKSGPDKNLVAVRYTLARGARLGAATITVKAGGDETKVVDLRPALDRTLEGKLFFRLDGMDLRFRKATIGNLAIQFDVPREIRDLPIVNDLLAGLLTDAQREIERFLVENVPFAQVFAGFGEGATKALAESVRRDAGVHGFTQITEVSRTEVVNGVMKVHVRGRTLRGIDLGAAATEAPREFARFTEQRRPRLQVPVGSGLPGPRLSGR